MERLDFGRVFEKFAALAHLTAEEAQTYLHTVKSAKAYFERLLKRDPEGCDEKDLCEYACACKAFFDYTVLRAATAKTYSTQSGGIYSRITEDETVMNADKLLRNAYAALPCGLIRDDGFVFEGVEG